MKYIYGIDIGGTSVKIGLLDLEGNFIDKWEVRTDTSDQGKNILPDIANSIKAYNTTHNIEQADIKGYGMGIPGPVIGNFIPICANLGWRNVQVDQEFAKYMGDVNIAANNDANVATLGEMWKGGGAGSKNVAMFTLGTGVGSGIVVDGKIVEGAMGAAGELGHMRVKFEGGSPCGCGKAGCLETVTSATGIVREAQRLFPTNKKKTQLLNNNTLSAKIIFDFARQGDEFALELVDNLGFYLGYACATVAVTTNPEIIIIGGGVSRAGKILIDVVEKHFQEFCFTSTAKTKFALASLGNDAGMIGAAYLIK